MITTPMIATTAMTPASFLQIVAAVAVAVAVANANADAATDADTGRGARIGSLRAGVVPCPGRSN